MTHSISPKLLKGGAAPLTEQTPEGTREAVLRAGGVWEWQRLNPACPRAGAPPEDTTTRSPQGTAGEKPAERTKSLAKMKQIFKIMYSYTALCLTAKIMETMNRLLSMC